MRKLQGGNAAVQILTSCQPEIPQLYQKVLKTKARNEETPNITPVKAIVLVEGIHIWPLQPVSRCKQYINLNQGSSLPRNGSSTPSVVTIVSLSDKCNRYCIDILPQTPCRKALE